MFAKAVLLAVALLGSAFILAPRDLFGAAAGWKECVDDAFADYNSCLMESSSWLSRKVCDFDFEFDIAVCTAGALGDVRKAWENGSSEPA